MATVRIPRTSARGIQTWARLILRVSRSGGNWTLDGIHLRPGSTVDEADLRPTLEFPATPFVIEFAGPTGLDSEGRRAHGHNRALDLHILWRYEGPAGWKEIASVESEGPEWRDHLFPIVISELARLGPVDHAEKARAASRRVCEAIDKEFGQLEDEGRRRFVSFLYDQIESRFTAELAADSAAALPKRKPVGRELRLVAERKKRI